ncbi:hypothetical protein OAQ99_06340 [Candidatus Kapabacteria bacterium]|nr:hypothetical protein [Candidatus Kapabacteria bacterium]
MSFNNQQIFDNMKTLLFAVSNDDENDLINCCKILLYIAGADGEVSHTEWQVIFEFIDSVGGSLKVVDDIRDFDFESANIEEIVKEINPDLYRILLYSALKAARIDGLSDQERIQSVELARLTGIDIGVAAAMEHLLNMEDELSDMKRSLLMKS